MTTLSFGSWTIIGIPAATSAGFAAGRAYRSHQNKQAMPPDRFFKSSPHITTQKPTLPNQITFAGSDDQFFSERITKIANKLS